jgi:hypothetical protein
MLCTPCTYDDYDNNNTDSHISQDGLRGLILDADRCELQGDTLQSCLKDFFGNHQIPSIGKINDFQ